MTKAVFLPEARDDIDEAYQAYESRVGGLGDRFLNSLHEKLLRIQDNPLLYGEEFDGIRAVMLRKFPFVVYYTVESKKVVVVAVRHGRDNPQIWQERVR